MEIVACPLVPGAVIVITNQFSVISDSVPSVAIMSSNNSKNKSGEKGKKVNVLESENIFLTREIFHNFTIAQ